MRVAKIPLPSRIISCCDAFNAMTTDRPYRRALGTAVAIAELRANSGTQFDPQVVEAFVAMIEAGVVEEVDPADQLDESEPVTV